jgi:uncharacterized protein (TIGR04255 family)
MLSTLSLSPKAQFLSRALSTLEFNFGDFNLRYQFGISNPDYPAVIKQKSFILDLDAYYRGIQDAEDIEGTLDKFHDCIQEFFESSITDKLRGIMNGRRERHSTK